MMRFFWTILLPVSATGACAAVLLWIMRPLLHRIGRMQWPAGAVIAVLCLFVIPVHLFIPRLPSAEMLLFAPLPAQNVPLSGTAAPNAFPFLTDGFPPSADADTFSAQGSLSSAATDPSSVTADAFSGDTSSANAGAGTANTAGRTPALKVLSVMMEKNFFLRVLPILWAAGMVLALFCNAISYLRFAVRLKRSSRTVTDAAMLNSLRSALRAAQQRCGAARIPELRCSDAIASPLAMGILRPCIYLPAGIPADASLDYALQHECVHLRKGHLFWKLAAQLVCAVHWFDPAAWLLPRLMNESCEFDCDRAVAAALDSRQRQGYCAALLDAADRGRVPQCVSAFARPAAILRKRIEAVLAPKPRLCKRIVSIMLCAALIFSAAGLTACAAGQAADSMASQLPASLANDAAGMDQSQDGDSLPEEAPVQSPENNVQTQPLSGNEQDEPDESTAEWVWPVPDMYYIANTFANGGHRGMDIAAPENGEILAVKAGTVTIAEYHMSYGNYVDIDHGDGMTSRYAHCSELLVSAGDFVTAGQPVARVGNTGYSSGNHCHLELIQDETLINPISVIMPGREVSAPSPIENATVSFRNMKDYSTPMASYDAAAQMLGHEPSDAEREQFEREAQYREITFRKPATAMNELKGTAYVTFTLCEYKGIISVCDVSEYGYSDLTDAELVSDVWVDVINSNSAQTASEVTVWASFQNKAGGEPYLITNTFPLWIKES